MKWNQVWSSLLQRDGDAFARRRDEVARDPSAPRVLMATGIAGYPVGALVESSLAVALTLRGAAVDFLVCDAVLPACQQSDYGDLAAPQAGAWPQPRCEKCYTQGSRCYAPLGLEVLRYGDYLDAATRAWAERLAADTPYEAIPAFELEGLHVGEHAHAGALRYFARGDLGRESAAESVLRAYFKAALLTTRGVQRLLDQRQYTVACFHHGIYVPQGLVGEVCRSRGVRVVNWNPAYRDHSFIFSHGDSYHHTMIAEPVETWEDIDLTPSMQHEIEQYLEDRRTGRGDWIWFLHPQDETPRPVSLPGLDRSRPFVTLLTSVMWDARLHYESNAFDSMLDWIVETIDYYAAHPDRQLVIRIHPAEVTGNVPSRQKVVDEIAARFTTLPANVFIVAPDDPLSTYDLIDGSHAVLVYNTKTGIEIASRGIPVVVAGEAWIRNKGFSLDASTRQEYVQLLDRLPAVGRLAPALRHRALKYAYHFFFRRMIPLPFVHSRERFKFELSLTSVQELAPGREPGLDCVCQGILTGAPFVFDPRPQYTAAPA